MKKLTTALLILTVPAICNATIVTITENHKFLGDDNPFRIMWSDIENYGSIFISTTFDQEVYRPYDWGFVQPHFVGIESNGELSNELQASWTFTADLVLNDFFGVNTPVTCEYFDRWCTPGLIRGQFLPDFEKYIGMELTIDIPIFNFLSYRVISEEQAPLVSNPELVRYDEVYGLYYDKVGLDENDMLVLDMNDFTVTYTYNDRSEENANISEPASVALLGLALVGGLWGRRRKYADPLSV